MGKARFQSYQGKYAVKGWLKVEMSGTVSPGTMSCESYWGREVQERKEKKEDQNESHGRSATR